MKFQPLSASERGRNGGRACGPRRRRSCARRCRPGSRPPGASKGPPRAARAASARRGRGNRRCWPSPSPRGPAPSRGAHRRRRRRWRPRRSSRRHCADRDRSRLCRRTRTFQHETHVRSPAAPECRVRAARQFGDSCLSGLSRFRLVVASGISRCRNDRRDGVRDESVLELLWQADYANEMIYRAPIYRCTGLRGNPSYPPLWRNARSATAWL